MSSGGQSTWVDRHKFLVQTAIRVGVVATLWLVTTGIVHLATEPLPACTTESTSACSGPPVDHSPNGGEYDSLPHCVTEDSDNCVWDARIDGNGEGRSFVTIDGVTYYLP